MKVHFEFLPPLVEFFHTEISFMTLVKLSDSDNKKGRAAEF